MFQLTVLRCNELGSGSPASGVVFRVVPGRCLSANRPPLIRNKLPPHLAALDLCSCSRASKIFRSLLLRCYRYDGGLGTVTVAWCLLSIFFFNARCLVCSWRAALLTKLWQARKRAKDVHLSARPSFLLQSASSVFFHIRPASIMNSS